MLNRRENYIGKEKKKKRQKIQGIFTGSKTVQFIAWS